MEDGHPGRPGASAAQAVRLGLKSASDPVTILHPGMVAGCVWGRAENRGKKKRVFSLNKTNTTCKVSSF